MLGGNFGEMDVITSYCDCVNSWTGASQQRQGPAAYHILGIRDSLHSLYHSIFDLSRPVKGHLELRFTTQDKMGWQNAAVLAVIHLQARASVSLSQFAPATIRDDMEVCPNDGTRSVLGKKAKS